MGSGIAIPILGELIPIIAIVLGIGMGMLSLYLSFRRKRELMQLYHAERMAAIEKGIELPPLPVELLRERRRDDSSPMRYRRRGLILLFLGITVSAALWGTHDADAWWGLVPAGLGVAYLLSSWWDRSEAAGRPGAGPTPGDSPPPDLQ